MYYRKFKEWIDKNVPENKAVIYGYGNMGRAIESMCNEVGCEVLFYLDDDKKLENCFSIENAPLFDAKVIIGIHYSHESVCKKIEEKCKLKGHKTIILGEFMSHIVGQTYGVPSDDQRHFIDEAIPLFEPNCFKEFLLRGYPHDYLIKNNRLMDKGYPYDLNAKYQSLSKMENLYFYNDVVISENDVVVDGGVSCGWEEQITNFAKYTKNTVYGFEPNIHSYKQISKETELYKNITVFNKGLANKNEVKYFVENGGGSMIVEEVTDVKIETTKLDDVLDHVDFIKMDIEGYELNALIGAKELIKKCKPKLAICLYHKPEDILEIPKYIKELEPNYKMWIVNNEGFRWSGIKMFAIYQG